MITRELLEAWASALAGAEGGLPAFKVGGLWFISRAELTR